MKHTFTVKNEGGCGHEYCPGNCQFTTTCSCGEKWYTKLSDERRTQHVLKAEGLMG